MAAVTTKQTEAMPASYPAITGLSTAAAAIKDAVWQRVEAYIAYRWTARTITWVVEGCGEWVPPLQPATISTKEIWIGEAWESVTLAASPLGGYDLPSFGPYRMSGTVGSGTPPTNVIEAVKRLAEYMVAEHLHPGARRWRENVDGVYEAEIERSPEWLARAMQASGAADLLRPYRRAG